MNYDKIIKKLFFIGDFKINKSVIIRYNKLKNTKYINLHEYILNRFNDSLSERETLYRIYYNIYVKPICPVCGNVVNFSGRNGVIFLSHCSNKCKKQDTEVNKKWKNSLGELGTNRQKAKQTMMDRYGVENPYQISEIIEKIKIINKEKKEESLLKCQQTCLEKYGAEYYIKTNEFKHKSKETSKQKYGVEYPIQSDKVKQKYNWKEIIPKIISTKEKHGTFNTSKQEDESYELLKEKYPDIIRQYKCDQYPFLCDFYIPSLDLFIECQYGWQHGKHPFNENDPEDIDKLNIMKTKQTKYYNNVIYNWSIRDVKKRQTAKENKLNYLEFWTIDELKNWLENK